MTTDQSIERDFHLLTTEALLNDLVSGRNIAIGDGRALMIRSDDARAILDWYRLNSGKWTANLTEADTEAIVDLVGTAPPTVTTSDTGSSQRLIKRLKIARVVAHGFAGLHAHKAAGQTADVFEFSPRKPVVLLEGPNGSGKTSLANAVVWCLTGYLLRSQRAPEPGPSEFECEVSGQNGEISSHLMSAVTPLPQKGSELPESGKPIPADTWVEVTLIDEDGVELPPLRREQRRSAKGKLVETEPDLEGVGIDPIAWRIATTMPGLLPFISLDAGSPLGEAVARLTGLSNLVDLAKHAAKVSDRIVKRTIKEVQARADDQKKQYGEQAEDLQRTLQEMPRIAFQGGVPDIADTDVEARLAAILGHFNGLKASGMAAAKEFLGEAFDAEDKPSRDELEASIHPAIQQLADVEKLPSMVRLLGLRFNDEQQKNVGALTAKLASEAETIARLIEEPERGRRAQLYARVSSWLHEHKHPLPESCPVCLKSFDGVVDPVSNKPVKDELLAAADDRETIGRTLTDWMNMWLGRLSRELPDTLARELKKDLPQSPSSMLRSALVDELFASPAFSQSLGGLRANAEKLIDEELESLPRFEEPAPSELPKALNGTEELDRVLRRIERAMAFSRWQQINAEPLATTRAAYQGGSAETEGGGRSVGERLQALLDIVERNVPLTNVITHVGRMDVARSTHQGIVRRKRACEHAVEALALITPLGDLAGQQVDRLRTKLHTRTEYWRKAMFKNATDYAPDHTGTSMDAKGVIGLKVGRDGVEAPAQHVSNASSLRGTLLGFLLAFREHVLDTRGGLETLLLDDPQELLDDDNRERLARGLTRLLAKGGQLLVTTHDRKFARSLVTENRGDDVVEHFSVHPVNSVRATLGLSPAIEEVDRKRDLFQRNPDDAGLAQDYASALRVFLELRLGDLFDDSTHPVHAGQSRSLTLFQLMDKLKGMIASGPHELFGNPVVRRFAEHPALQENQEPRRVLNKSHHEKETLSYMDVKDVAPQFLQLRGAIEDVHQQFRFYRWREGVAPEVPATNVAVLRPISRPTFRVPVYPDLAAFVGNSPSGGSQAVPDEQVTGEWFEGKSLFYIRGDTLGFAIPSGSVAIVEAEPYPGADHNLVIARPKGQVLARRLIKSTNAIGVSLAAQMPDPRQSRRSLSFDESKVRLHKVVGAIFSHMAPPDGKNEAIEIENVPELSAVAVGYRVKDESAVPLALPGQLVLGGAQLTPAELSAWEGRLVAVSLDDGSTIFKRVGAALPGRLRYLRQFETIGGLGNSIVVSTEAADNSLDVPLMVHARKIIGVLYA